MAVGIVLVSHSEPLARAALDLAGQMLHGADVRIEVAAGVDGAEGRELGTDAIAVMAAIGAADAGDGVLVLVDMGSALLSTDLALEMLDDPGLAERVVVSAGPFVEGLVVASVAAAGGASLAEVAAEARGALAGKAEAEPAEAPEPTAPSAAAEPPADALTGTFTVTPAHGLHARPAARLVAALRGLDAEVTLRNLSTGAGPVPGASLSRVATFGARRGHDVEVTASGPAAQSALDAVLALAARDFDEPPEPSSGVETDAVSTLQRTHSAGIPGYPGIPAAGPLPGGPGVAVGPARPVTAATVEVDLDETASSPSAERDRLGGALAAARHEIDDARRATAASVGEAEAAVFDAHAALLDDPDLHARVDDLLDAGSSAPAAWARAVGELAERWGAVDDPYLRERVADVEAVGQQVLRALTGTGAEAVGGEGVLVARDLTPATAGRLDPARTVGVVLAAGSATSHAAILVRALGVPLVVAAGPEVLEVAEGTTLALDGGAGELEVDPPADHLTAWRARAEGERHRAEEERARAHEPATTRDGSAVAVAANLASLADAEAAAGAGADEAGLVRTELLFLDRDTAPDEDEQVALYVALGRALGRRLTLRTLDVGGDKPLPYLPVPPEDNPFLGRRGVRLTLAHPALLRTQLAAVARAAREVEVQVMVPMVAAPSEVAAVRAVLDDVGPPPGLRLGMMVEVPAAALKIEAFVPHLDFVSIGTNDLTQYALAAERGNPSVAALADPLDPGVLRLVAQVGAVADRVDVAVCGEAGADPLAVPLLLGLGVGELSVSPAAVARVKAQVRGLDLSACRDLARRALDLPDAAAVRALVAAAALSRGVTVGVEGPERLSSGSNPA